MTAEDPDLLAFAPDGPTLRAERGAEPLRRNHCTYSTPVKQGSTPIAATISAAPTGTRPPHTQPDDRTPRPRYRPTREYLQASRERENDRIAALRKRSVILALYWRSPPLSPSWRWPWAYRPTISGQADIAGQQADARSGRRPAFGWSPRPSRCWPVPVTAARCGAYQQLVAARRLAQDDGPLVNALVNTVNLIKVAEAGAQVSSVAFSPDGTRIASGSYDKTVRCGMEPAADPSAMRNGESSGM